MTYQVKCDACGKVVDAPVNGIGNPYNPPGWRSRKPLDVAKTYHACSEPCLDICKTKYGGAVGLF